MTEYPHPKASEHFPHLKGKRSVPMIRNGVTYRAISQGRTSYLLTEGPFATAEVVHRLRGPHGRPFVFETLVVRNGRVEAVAS